MADSLEGNSSLLAAFRRGEPAALSRVYHLYVGEVVRALRSGTVVHVDGQPMRLGTGISEGDLEVLVQNTFLRAFSPSARTAYDGVRPYGNYLVTIARNLLVDDARAKKRHARVVLVENIDDVVLDGSPEPTARLEQEQLARALEEVRRGLSPFEQDLFRLRYAEGMSQREVAGELGLSLITIRRKDIQLREKLLAGLRRMGHLYDAVVGIPSSERDRTRG